MQKTLFDATEQNGKSDQTGDQVTTPSGYKETKAGVIPNSWKVAQLRDLIREINAGYSAKSRDRTIQDGEKGVLKVSAATQETFQPKEHKAVLPEAEDDVKTSPRAGDLVMSRSNGTESLVGACVYVEQDYPRLYLPDTLWQIRVEDGVSARWFNYALASERMRAKIRGEAYGTSGMKKLSMRRLRGLRIGVPPVEEQRQIAEILGVCDHLIEQVDALVNEKKKCLHGLRQRLLTGGQRFPECTDSGEMKEVDIGEVPADWTQKRLGDLFTWKTKKNEDNAIEKVITVGKDEIRDQEEHFNRSVASDDLSNYRIIEPGDFVYDPMSAYYGALGRYDLEKPGVVSPAYRVLQLNDGYHSDFVKFLLESHYVRFRIDASSLQNNKSGKRRGLRQDAFASIQVHIPPIEEQRRIAQILGAAETEIQKLKEKREALKRQKKGLMQRLLTGAVRTV